MTQEQLDRRAAQAADDRIDAEEGWRLIREMDARQAADAALVAVPNSEYLTELSRQSYLVDRQAYVRIHDKWLTAREVDEIQSECTDWRM